MSSHPHILILGAGLIGLSTADALLSKGARVTVIESKPAPMLGASHANSGMIHPSQACSWSGSMNDPAIDAAVFDLACQSWTLMAQLMLDLGLTGMASRPAGCWQIFDTDEAAQAAQNRLKARTINVSYRAAADSLFGHPALFFPDDHSGDAKVYGDALAQSVRQRGAQIITDAGNVMLKQRPDGTAALSGVTISDPFDHVIVACGAQSNAILDPLRVSLSIKAVRGWAADFIRPKDSELPSIPVMDARSRSALTLFGDVIRLSGTWGEDSVEPLLERWSKIMPDIMAKLGPPLQTWSGLRPVSALGRPFIGPTPIPGLWVNAGHGHMGWTLCAASGQLMAEMIVEGALDRRFAIVSEKAA